MEYYAAVKNRGLCELVRGVAWECIWVNVRGWIGSHSAVSSSDVRETEWFPTSYQGTDVLILSPKG